MEPYLETAIQWLYDTIRVQLRARAATPPPPEAEWVTLCWEVGHSLSMMQAHGIPAQPVIDAVSEKLMAEFGSEGDLTPYGIRTMRQFYLDYFERSHLQPLIRAIGWDQHKIILSLCRDPAQQEYYLALAKDQGLSAEVLTAAIKEGRYETSAGLRPPSKVAGKAAAKGAGRGSARVGRKA